MTTVRGVVLAGGESSRFGTDGEDKALARIGSDRLLGRVVRTLADATRRRPLVVVGSADRRATYAEALAPVEAAFGFDVPGHEGPIAGLFGAAAAVDDAAMFCCGCDMPLLDARAVAWLVERFEEGGGVDAVAVEYPDGVLEPLHAVYRRRSVADLRGRLPRTAGPRALFAELDAVRAVPLGSAPADVPLERSLTNVNTVAELGALADGTDDADGTGNRDGAGGGA